MGKATFFMSGARGRMGNVIFYQRKGKTYFRSMPASVKDPKTDAQMGVRSKFTDSMEYLKQIKHELRITWTIKERKQSEFNAAMQYMMKNAYKEEDGETIIDRTKVKHAYGRLSKPFDIQVKLLKSKKLEFSWIDNTGYGGANIDDEFCFVICETKENIVMPFFTHTERKDKKYVHEMGNDWKGQKIAVYGFFIGKDQKEASEDEFLGYFGIGKQ